MKGLLYHLWGLMPFFPLECFHVISIHIYLWLLRLPFCRKLPVFVIPCCCLILSRIMFDLNLLQIYFALRGCVSLLRLTLALVSWPLLLSSFFRLLAINQLHKPLFGWLFLTSKNDEIFSFILIFHVYLYEIQLPRLILAFILISLLLIAFPPLFCS